jgi:hypothetical protein
VYAQYRKAIEELPSLLDDPEGRIAKWQEIHGHEAELQQLMPTSTEPLPPYPTG